MEQQIGEPSYPTNGLGDDFLRRYQVVIEFSSSSLYLTPDPLYKEDKEEWISTGMELTFSNGSAFIAHVYSPSSASSAGLEAGDEVIEIEGHRVAEMSQIDLLSLLHAKKKLGETVQLTVVHEKGARPRKVTLQVKSIL